MSNLEHYFENLLFHGEDIKGEANKNALTEEQQKAVEQCAQYVIYSLFGTRERFDEWRKHDTASPWNRVEDVLPEIGKIVLVYDEWHGLSICQLDKQYRWLRQGGGWFDAPYARYWMPVELPEEDVNGM